MTYLESKSNLGALTNVYNEAKRIMDSGVLGHYHISGTDVQKTGLNFYFTTKRAYIDAIKDHQAKFWREIQEEKICQQ